MLLQEVRNNASALSGGLAIRTYVRRQGRITTAQRRAWRQHAQRYIVAAADSMPDWARIFNADKPLVVEIGCGYGEATAAMAAADERRQYAVFEVHAPGIGALMNLLAGGDIQNVRIVHGDAVEGIARLFADGAVAAFNIFFPDPWPKKKHHKRRLICPLNLALLQRKLAPGGGLHFVTDWQPYAEQADAVCTAAGLASAPPPPRAATAYEARGVAAGRAIYDLYFIKRG